MTINELVQLLETYPPETRVVVDGYEDGYDDLSPDQISIVQISLNMGKHQWEGQHGDPNGLMRFAPDIGDLVEALVLRRVSN